MEDTKVLNQPQEIGPVGYEYTHTDGISYSAESLDGAIQACPVLGKMAIEQASLLLEVAAIGQQKIQEEQPTQSVTQAEQYSSQPEPKLAAKITEHSHEAVQATPNMTNPSETLLAEIAVPVPEKMQQVQPTVDIRQVMEPVVTKLLRYNGRAELDKTSIPGNELAPTAPIQVTESRRVNPDIPLQRDTSPSVSVVQEEPKFGAKTIESYLKDSPVINEAMIINETTQGPPEIHEGLTETHPVIGAEAPQDIVDIPAPEMSLTDRLQIEVAEKAEHSPAIVIEVAEELKQLTPEQMVEAEPLINLITEKILVIQELLETVDPIVIETMEEELEQSVTALFEQLRLEYQPEDIEKFIAVLLRLNPVSPKINVNSFATMSPHDIGTHEARRGLTSRLHTVTDDLGRTMKQLIGMYVLRHAVTHT